MLLLDIGNSAVKAQYWQDNELSYALSVRYQSGWQSRFEAFLKQVNALDCHYASVVKGQTESDLLNCLGRFIAANNIHEIKPLASAHGVRNAYQPAEAIGVDRWLCLLGAPALVPGDLMIVDAGSAITIDLMRADGQHMGGAILPGFNTTMARFKQILHRADFEHPDINKNEAPGCSTEACIHIDYAPADASPVKGLIDRWFKRLSKQASLIVTGSDANRIEPCREHQFQIVPDLVFQGMRRQLESQP